MLHKIACGIAFVSIGILIGLFYSYQNGDMNYDGQLNLKDLSILAVRIQHD